MKKYFKILLITILTLLVTLPVVNAEVVTQDRNTLPNYGVNKKWTITDGNKGNVISTPKVDATEKIYDFENVLSEEEKKQLKQEIDNYMEKTGFELIIVIKNLPYSYDDQNETFATDFYDYNDFGLELKGYSGTLLFRNTYEQDPYYDFYMFGEAQLYYQGDNRNNLILDNIYDELHSGNYLSGFNHYINDLTNFYDKGIAKSLKDYKVDENGYLYEDREFHVHYPFIILFSLILTAFSMGIMVSKNKMIKKAIEARDYLDMASVRYRIRTDHLSHTHTESYHIYTSDGGGHSSGGSFHSSGGSSGGGHSSGGGRHG